MAKQDADCITLDLFANTRKVGRPKTNPLSREQQIRINKRNQLKRDKSIGLKRDKSIGLKRVELKLHTDLVEQLEDLAANLHVSRSELIVTILQDYFNIQEDR
ncbi:LexA regulated protein [Pasteurella multocida]|uniref:LexA regulated protein n=1 Tax=Pasteurella multocida TaxID=747 RepID=UPI00397C1521